MVNMDANVSANHSGGYGIKYPFDFQGTAAGHFQAKLAIVHEAFTGQRLQGQLFVFKAALTTFVQAVGDFVQKRLVIFNGGKISTPSQFQGLIQAAFEGTMRTFNGTVFMAHAKIIAGRTQVIMSTQAS